ncbi:MAG TPA: outer membrane beta-barrel protein [Chryseolinea sp.]|nr:outer membrane beta-barrel protein [Chryseolinea sp.]
MKTLLLVIAVSSIGGQSFSQANIFGQISDRQQRLPSVTVMLLSIDSAVVKGVVTDSVGKFVIESIFPGHYIISASMVGYAKFVSPIEVTNRNIALPLITLEDEPTALHEVVVKGERQRFEQEIDRTVINLEGSITSSGNTILEILQKSPGVVVNRQNNTITINGKSGVRLMINNKLMQLPTDAVIQMMDGMSGSNVEKIEIITAPSSEYDAEGNGGIINIVTMGGKDFGTNASLGLTIGARWAENLGANFNIHHRGKKIAYFADYSIVRNHNMHIVQMNRESTDDSFGQTITSDSRRENITTQQNLNAGLEWQVAKKTTLNFLFTGYNRNWKLSALTEDINRVRMDSSITTGMKIHESNVWKSANGSFGVQTRIDEKSEVSLSLDYLFYHNDNPSTYENAVIIEPANSQSFNNVDVDKTTPIRTFVAKMDYKNQISPSVLLEGGIKSVTSTLDNNVLVQELVAGVWVPDPMFTSYSMLDERIYAGYFSTKVQVDNQLQINGGIRYEYTQSVISSRGENDLTERRYGYFFPTLSIKKNLGLEEDLEISYTRRITRPTYNDIAPYVFFWGPNTFSAGNTSLYPAVSDAVRVGYSYKHWSTSVQYSHVRNEITMLQPEIDDAQNLFYRSQNLKYLNTIGWSVNYSTSISTWWELQSNLTAQYQSGRTSSFNANTSLQLFSVNINLINIFKLPRDFAIEISGIYQSRALSGISQFLPVGSLNAGIQKSFGDKGILRLSMDDILYTNYWRIKTTSPENGLNTYFSYNWHNQFIRLTYTRNLGNTKLKSLRLKSGSEEERSRIGG